MSPSFTVLMLFPSKNIYQTFITHEQFSHIAEFISMLYKLFPVIIIEPMTPKEWKNNNMIPVIAEKPIQIDSLSDIGKT
jgi:hypothetical protein